MAVSAASVSAELKKRPAATCPPEFGTRLIFENQTETQHVVFTRVYLKYKERVPQSPGFFGAWNGSRHRHFISPILDSRIDAALETVTTPIF